MFVLSAVHRDAELQPLVSESGWPAWKGWA
jgi:hypothetical protein